MKTAIALRMIETQGRDVIEGIQPSTLNLSTYAHILTEKDTVSFGNAINSVLDNISAVAKNEQEKSGRHKAMDSILASGITDILSSSIPSSPTSYEPII